MVLNVLLFSLLRNRYFWLVTQSALRLRYELQRRLRWNLDWLLEITDYFRFDFLDIQIWRVGLPELT